MEPSSPPPAIDFDLPCTSCGYNLRTLPRAARCPECNAPILITLFDSPFTWSRDHLRQVKSAVNHLVVAQCAQIAASIFLLCAWFPIVNLLGCLLILAVMPGIPLGPAFRIFAAHLLPPLGAAHADNDHAPLRLAAIFEFVALCCWMLGMAMGPVPGAAKIVGFAGGAMFLLWAAFAYLLASRLSFFCRRCQWPSIAGAFHWMFRASAIALVTLGFCFAALGVADFDPALALLLRIAAAAFLVSSALALPLTAALLLLRRRLHTLAVALLPAPECPDPPTPVPPPLPQESL